MASLEASSISPVSPSWLTRFRELWRTPARRNAALTLGVVGLVLSWSYWPALVELVQRWWSEKNYSHGFLVPLFSVWLLWSRRRQITFDTGLYWGALVLFAGAGLLRCAAAFLYFDWLEGISLLICLAGTGWLVGGKKCLRWCLPAVAFLAFMIPLPYRFERALSLPLQRFATVASTYALQTFGIPAYSEGNVIHLREVQMGIVEACNGLGMMMSFLALATGMAFVAKRQLLDRLIVVASSIPIALLTNVIRITGTGIAYEVWSREVGDLLVHDLAGWLMPPIALGFLLLEVVILNRLLVTPKAFRLSPVALKRSAGKGKAPGSAAATPKVQPEAQVVSGTQA